MRLTRSFGKRKAQTEIVGLALIVILLSLSLLFVIKFVVVGRPNNLVRSVDEIQLASNTISAMLDTHYDCSGLKVTIADLYVDCFRAETYDCAYSDADGDGNDDHVPDSCDTVQAGVQDMLNATLDARNYKYRYTATLVGSDPPVMQESSNDDCSAASHLETYPLPLNPGTVRIQLRVCN